MFSYWLIDAVGVVNFSLLLISEQLGYKCSDEKDEEEEEEKEACLIVKQDFGDFSQGQKIRFRGGWARVGFLNHFFAEAVATENHFRSHVKDFIPRRDKAETR